jgi:NAD(P)-dependent dehydrogenase (short-subunit alcohol dehydrogenase family)
MSLIARIKGVGPSGFGFGSTADDVTEGLDLRGRTMLVTGCNSGIGLETARTLAKRGVHLFATGRTEQKARQACATLGREVFPIACELSDPTSIRACIETVKRQIRRLDAIICNAGIMALPTLERAFGYEMQFFTNHIGHFLLVTGLLDSLADDGRVVVVSSEAHKNVPPGGIDFDNLTGERGYSPWKAYGQSKLANLLFAKQLAKRLSGTTKTANAIHPGVIRTNLGRTMPSIMRLALSIGEPLFLKSAAQGAATQCYVATNPNLATVSGEYFLDCDIAEPTRFARDPALAARLWDESERIVATLL